MKVIVCALLLLLGSSGILQQQNLTLEVGSKIPAEMLTEEHGFIALPDFMPAIEASVDGIKYELAYTKSTGIIKYIFTEDENFMTVDGLRVGACIPLTKKQLGSTRGGLTRGPVTADGWTPIIGYRAHITTCQQDSDESPVVIHKDKVPTEEGMLEAKIIKFMK